MFTFLGDDGGRCHCIGMSNYRSYYTASKERSVELFKTYGISRKEELKIESILVPLELM